MIYNQNMAQQYNRNKILTATPAELTLLLYEGAIKRTDTAYFHDWIFGKASEVRFLRGRLKFTDEDGNGEGAAPFPSAVIVWRSPESTGREFATWHI